MQYEFEQKLGKNNPKISTNKSFEFRAMFWAILSVNTTGYWFSFKRIIWFWTYFPEEPRVFGSSRLREICFENSTDLLITDFCSPTISQTIDLFSLYVLSSQFRPRDALQGISLFFHLSRIPMHRMYAHKTTFERNSPLGYQSRGLKWENKTYKLKRSIMWRMHCISKTW